MHKTFLILGGANLFLTVAFGAFAAHGLKGKVSDALYQAFQTGAHYQGLHALGLVLIGILLHTMPDSIWLRWSGWTIFLGIVLFSGSLYLMTISGISKLGMITPIGGLSFLIGWTLFIIAIIKS